LRIAREILRYAQDFGSRLPLRSRLLDASSSSVSGPPLRRGRDPSLRSGFRQQARAALTPARRLKFEPLRPAILSTDPRTRLRASSSTE